MTHRYKMATRQESPGSVMVNSTVYDTASKAAFLNSDVLFMSLLSLLLISFGLLLFLMSIMVSVYFSISHLQEEPRYILFVHMLINDTIYITLSLLGFFSTAYLIYFPVPISYIVVSITSSALKVTPYNLAVMSLERYVAICFPLRHSEWWTRQKTILAIVVIWIIGLVPNVIDFMILCFSVHSDYFYLYCLCSRSEFMKSNGQDILKSLTYALGFSLVALIIVFTYIKIMLVAIKVDSGKAVASRAGKTVILHAFQLLLCMMAFSYSLTEMFLKKYLYMLPVINFFFFMCLPRVISPLVYGLRDEVFFRYIKRIVLCKSLRTSQNPGTI
ncbi:odorant receptor 131-2-like [Dendropsophus ebraccatus]|uniref:odorant receptor 131-2-like n=1 Tax=Dendropsophus ebraccatus TaxID=150705 RepID=UPI003830FDA6